jgi:hypothetical protein
MTAVSGMINYTSLINLELQYGYNIIAIMMHAMVIIIMTSIDRLPVNLKYLHF